MKHVVLSSLLTLFLLGFASHTATAQRADEMIIDKPAEFPDGAAKWNKFLKKNLKYPKVDRKAKVEGDVLLSFVVGVDGAVSDVEVIRTPSETLGAEAKRVLQKSPKWKPGEFQGKAVKSRMEIRIGFRL